MKDFNEIVIEECTSLELSQKGTGSATLAFTPDSHRLVLGLALEAAVVVVELPNEFDDAMGVSRTFSLAQVEGARVTRRLPRRHSVSGKPDGKSNGKATNGHLEMNGMDVDAEEQASSVDEDTPESDDEDSDDEDDEGASGGSQLLRAELLAVSEDGQWLAVADTSRKTAIYNLDALKVSLLLEIACKFAKLTLYMTASYIVSCPPSRNRLHQCALWIIITLHWPSQSITAFKLSMSMRVNSIPTISPSGRRCPGRAIQSSAFGSTPQAPRRSL